MPEFARRTERSQVVPRLHEDQPECVPREEESEVRLVLCCPILVTDKTRGIKCL